MGKIIYVYKIFLWVSDNSTDKVFDSWIRNLGFNLHLRQKPINILVSKKKKKKIYMYKQISQKSCD